jgi:hypothetical protein
LLTDLCRVPSSSRYGSVSEQKMSDIFDKACFDVRGGELFIDVLSTFTATELISYNDFVALTVIGNALALKKVDLKRRRRSVLPLSSLLRCRDNTN